MTAEQPSHERKKGHISLSGISVFLAVLLAGCEGYFFWGAGRDLFGSLDGSLGIFTPDRLGFNMAWLVFVYLSYQIISIPFSMANREQFIGVLDGLASVLPLVVAAIGIFDRFETLKTGHRGEAAILLVLVSLADLIGGFAITIGLSRRTIGFGGPTS
jgi:hypothetical protein